MELERLKGLIGVMGISWRGSIHMERDFELSSMFGRKDNNPKVITLLCIKTRGEDKRQGYRIWQAGNLKIHEIIIKWA